MDFSHSLIHQVTYLTFHELHMYLRGDGVKYLEHGNREMVCRIKKVWIRLSLLLFFVFFVGGGGGVGSPKSYQQLSCAFHFLKNQLCCINNNAGS